MTSVLLVLPVLLLMIQLPGDTDGAATITETPNNATAKVGDSASFYCGITGTQDQGQYHTFRKISPTASLVASDSNPSNATKYNITDTYRLTINDVAISDEGGYQCDLFPNTYSMYLIVIDPPTQTTLTWSDSPAGTPGNLTCSVPRSRPPATFRWSKGSTDMTSDAVSSTGTLDMEGYGSATSSLQLTLSVADIGTVYTCYVDVAGVQNVTQASITVTPSGAAHLYSFSCVVSVLLAFAASQFGKL